VIRHKNHIISFKKNTIAFTELLNLNNGRKEQFMKNPRMLGKFLASVYNCGPARQRLPWTDTG